MTSFPIETISEHLRAVEALPPLAQAYQPRLISRQVHAAYAGLKSRMKTIETAQKTLEDALDDLRKLQDETRQSLNPIINLSSRVLRFPSEVLQPIFAFGHQAWLSDLDKEAEPSDPSAYLFTITHTCGDWRADAIAMSELWCRIHVEWATEQKETWLTRAGPTKRLDIFMQGIVRNRHIDAAIVRTASVFNHCLRWRSITIAHCSRRAVSQFLDATRDASTSFPVLESLSLQMPEKEHMRATVLSLTGLSRALHQGDYNSWEPSPDEFRRVPDTNLPALHRLVVKRVDFFIGNLVTEARHLEINEVKLFDNVLERTLRAAQQLEGLSLSHLELGNVFEQDDESIPSGSLIRQNHLRRLVLGRGNDVELLTFVLWGIQAPSLRYLCLDVPSLTDDRFGELISSFDEFLGNSPLIETLVLYGDADDCCMLLSNIAEDLPGTSSSLRHLKSLTLGSYHEPPPNDPIRLVGDWPNFDDIVKPFIQRQISYHAEHHSQNAKVLDLLRMVRTPPSNPDLMWLIDRVERIDLLGRIDLTEAEGNDERYRSVEGAYAARNKCRKANQEPDYLVL